MTTEGVNAIDGTKGVDTSAITESNHTKGIPGEVEGERTSAVVHMLAERLTLHPVGGSFMMNLRVPGVEGGKNKEEGKRNEDKDDSMSSEI